MIHDIDFLEFATALEAIQYAAANRPVAIRFAGKNFVVRREDADKLEAAGAEFAYLTDGGGYDRQVITIPVN